MYTIGFDVGSSSIKAALFDAGLKRPVATVQSPDSEMEMISLERGWAEQHPDTWWHHVCLACQKLLDKTGVKSTDIKAVGIAYQMHGLVVVDKAHNVLRPSIIWCDSRAVSIGNAAFETLGPRHCLEHYLNSPGNFTATKLKWVQDNEPKLYEKIYKVMLPGDFVGMKLTGAVRTTVSGLSEGVMWDFKNKAIANDLLDYLNIDNQLLPEVITAFDSSGEVTRTASEQTGLPVGIPVTYRAGDQPNNAMALNVLNPGEIAATCGTSGVIYGVVDQLVHDIRSRINSFAHVNHSEDLSRIGVLMCINGAGSQYSWVKNQIAQAGTTYDDMERMMDTIPPGSEGVCVLPFGNGAERIFDNRDPGSHIFNLEFNRHSRAHVFRAAVEGVAFAFVYGVRLLSAMGLKLDVIRVGNDNMFRSATFARTIATLLGNRIEVIDTTGAIGAAQAAGIEIGLFKNIEEAVGGQQPSLIYEASLDYGMCSEAYRRWISRVEDIRNS